MSRLEIDPGDRRGPVPPPPPSPKRGLRFGGVAKAVAAALAVAVLAWGVRYGGDYFGPPAAPPGPVPVIGPDAGPVKVVPDNPGGVAVPDQDKVILNGNNAQPKVEQLLPPPETPLASPAPPPSAAAPPVSPPAPAPPQPAAQTQPAPPPPPQPATPPMQAAIPQDSSAPPASASTLPRQAVPAPAVVPPPPPKPAMSRRETAAAARCKPCRRARDISCNWARCARPRPRKPRGPGSRRRSPTFSDPCPPTRCGSISEPSAACSTAFWPGRSRMSPAATRACNTLKERHVACILVKP